MGYKTYLELIPDLLEGKKVFASGMKREIERCQIAIEQALAGHHVAVVSSGDAGIYGMAGLVLDICKKRGLEVANSSHATEENPTIEFEVIPGVAAVNAAASILGAPLMHDFAVISLSDHLTSWDLIEKRLFAAASADFVIAIYNPRSKTRPHLLEEAVKIISKHRPDQTPVAIVRSAMRVNQWCHITTLAQIPVSEVDMQSIVIVGNTSSYVWKGWMITPRGYLEKYGLQDE